MELLNQINHSSLSSSIHLNIPLSGLKIRVSDHQLNVPQTSTDQRSLPCGLSDESSSYQHLTTITESERYFALLPYKKDLPTNLDEETLRLVEQDLGRKEKT